MSGWRRISSDLYAKLHDTKFQLLQITDSPVPSENQSWSKYIQTRWNDQIALTRTQVSLADEYKDVKLHKLESENVHSPTISQHNDDNASPENTCRKDDSILEQHLPLYTRSVHVKRLRRYARLREAGSPVPTEGKIDATMSAPTVEDKVFMSPDSSTTKSRKDSFEQMPFHLRTSTSCVPQKVDPRDSNGRYMTEHIKVRATPACSDSDTSPDFLLPVSYARKDFKFNLTSCIASHLDLSGRYEAGPLSFRWDGKYECSVKVVDSKERVLLAIQFLAIKQIKYHLEQQKFFFEYDEISGLGQFIVQFKTEKLVELQSFKHCGYTICKDRERCSCDAASAEEFERMMTLVTTVASRRAKIAESTREKEVQPLPDPLAVCGERMTLTCDLKDPGTEADIAKVDEQQCVSNETLLPIQDLASRTAAPITTDQASLDDTPAILMSTTLTSSAPVYSLSLTRSPVLEDIQAPTSTPVLISVPESVPVLAPSPTSRPPTKPLPVTVSAPLFAPVPASRWLKRRVENPTANTCKRRKVEPPRKQTFNDPPGLYYDMCSQFRKRVEIGDLVVRLRTQKATALEGKRDKFDVFDGPWELTAVECAPNNHLFMYSHERKDFSKEQEHAFRKMLTTKVQLKFPRGSSAPNTWFAIEHLLPCLDPHATRIHFIHPHSLIVASLQSFLSLKLYIDNDDKAADKFWPHDMKLCDKLAESDERLYVVEINEAFHVAIIELSPEAEGDEQLYEVEKLRNKRLRLCQEGDDSCDVEDPWIKRLRKQYSDLLAGQGLFAEYLVHWCGWPNEDDSWEVAKDNIPQDLIDEFHHNSDAFRDFSPEDMMSPEQVIWQADLDTLEGSWRQSMFVTD